MADSPLNQIGPLATAYAMLAAPALPLAIALQAMAKAPARDRPLRPSTLELLVLLLLAFILPPNLLATGEAVHVFEAMALHGESERAVLANILGCILWVTVFAVWCRRRGSPSIFAVPAARWRRDLSAGLFGFLAITPITFAIYLAATAIMEAFGSQPDRHRLMDIDLSRQDGMALFIAGSCFFGPVIEELTIRGLLLPWARQRRVRPWIIFALGLFFLCERLGHGFWGKILLIIDVSTLMAFAYFGRQVWKKWPSRTASAIVSTAVLFGAMHAAVWPTPIPLTVLGLGLGYLTMRRGSPRPAIIAHALFNAVSVIHVLRGGS